MLVVLDIDGTLVGADGEMPDSVLKAADTLREMGARIVLATGRPFEGVGGRMAERVDPSAPHVFLNGGLVRTGRGRVVREVELAAESLHRQIDASRRWDVTLELYDADTYYADELTDPCRRHAEALELEPTACDLEELVGERSILKTQWIVDENRVDDVLQLDLPESVTEVGSSPILPGWTFVQGFPADSGKGGALEAVAAQLDEDLSGAVAVGDSPSDRSMLELVGHPFAMGNAAASLRETYRTVGDVEDEGVLEVLEYAAQLAYRGF